ncbi:hypothetical protein ABHF33_01245 [Chitinibacter sp. FCG-7]|uniref:Tox-GHH2 domain-containing protein n=1 Tax=Chitinibacter mangrovi TaxID=3153927 RepID=A0AAU7FB77_9NEIS
MANTAAFRYWDDQVKEHCEKTTKDINNECKCDGTKEAKEKRDKQFNSGKMDPAKLKQGSILRKTQAKLREALVNIDQKAKDKIKEAGHKESKENCWVYQQCTGLWHKPTNGDGFSIDSFKDEMRTHFEKEAKQIMHDQKAALEKLQNFADDFFKEQADEIAEKAKEKVIKRMGTMRSPLLAKALSRIGMYEMLGHAIGNTVGAIVTNDMEKRYAQLELELDQFTSKLDEITAILGNNFSYEDLMATMQAGIALSNDCLRARKCKLVSYNDNKNPMSGNGCCPGQTAHHVLPDAMFYNYEKVTKTKGKPPNQSQYTTLEKTTKLDCWSKYSHGSAPTMCLEGTSNGPGNGSHGAAHTLTEDYINDKRNQPSVPYNKTADDISERLAKPYGCKKECIKAQLDKYYKEAHTCKDSEAAVTPHSGLPNGGPTVPTKPPKTKTF